MAKPVISIDVDDAKFQKFLDLFNSYQEKLADQPEAWDSANKAMGAAGDTLKTNALAGADALALAAAQAELIADHVKEAGKAQSDFTRSSKAGWDSFSRSGQSAAKGVGKAFSGAVGGSIAEMSSGIADVAKSAAAALGPIGFVAGAIGVAIASVGAGAVLLKAGADAAVARQRAAFGLGTTTGKQGAFDVYSQQFLGDNDLRNAAHDQRSYSSAGALATLGISFDQARKMSAGDLAIAKLRGAVAAAQANPNMPLENLPAIQQYMALGGNSDDVQNALEMLKTNPKALDQMQAEVARNAGRMNLDTNAVAKAAKFKMGVEGAGVAVQSGFINNFSGGDAILAKIIDALTGGNNGLNTVARTIETKVDPALQQFNHALNVATGGLLHQGKNAINASNDRVNSVTSGALTSASVHARFKRLLGISSGSVTDTIMAVAREKGVDPIAAIAYADKESGLDPKNKGDYGWFDSAGNFHPGNGPGAHYTSFGLYQLHERGELGNLTPEQAYDPRTNAEVSIAEYARVAKLHPNWTPGHIAAEAQRPADKVGYAREVDAIYARMRADRSSKPNVNVHVTNSTASNVAASVNAGAQL